MQIQSPVSVAMFVESEAPLVVGCRPETDIRKIVYRRKIHLFRARKVGELVFAARKRSFSIFKNLA